MCPGNPRTFPPADKFAWRKLWEYNAPRREKHPYCLLRIQNYNTIKFLWLNPSLHTTLHTRSQSVTQGKCTFFHQSSGSRSRQVRARLPSLSWSHSPHPAVPTYVVLSISLARAHLCVGNFSSHIYPYLSTYHTTTS